MKLVAEKKKAEDAVYKLRMAIRDAEDMIGRLRDL